MFEVARKGQKCYTSLSNFRSDKCLFNACLMPVSFKLRCQLEALFWPGFQHNEPLLEQVAIESWSHLSEIFMSCCTYNIFALTIWSESPAASGKHNVHDVKLINLSFVSDVQVIKEVERDAPPPLPNLNQQKVCWTWSVEQIRWVYLDNFEIIFHISPCEYPQHMFLWRTDENYPLIIIKYPPYLFHWSISNCFFFF